MEVTLTTNYFVFSRYQRLIEKQTAIDEQELANLVNDRKRFLLKAVENYIKCLKCGDQHNLCVFRLTSLWFNNVGIEEVNTMMQVCQPFVAIGGSRTKPAN